MHDAYRFALDAWDVRHLILLVPVGVGYTFWLRRWFDKRYRRRDE